MEILRKYPMLIKQFDVMFDSRRNEILTEMLENDDEYMKLCEMRSDSSTALKNAAIDANIDDLFEGYSDAVFAHETYELDSLYKIAVEDTLNVLADNNLI